ncbi:MAG: type I-E CRISPR-associated protein Cas6/Cse3/CasE [Bacillota bacterium]|nr:type I-E CRISPR-associated protein Cas6/Cse3/CasE [Bacillota bacterium]
MYLSCLELDFKNPAVRQCLKNCVDMHRTIMKAFPAYNNKNQARKEGEILYRILANDACVKVFILSRDWPEWDKIKADGFSAKVPIETTPLVNKFNAGSVFNFDIAACPTKKIDTDGKNSRRVSLRTAQERQLWMTRKAEQYGFNLTWLTEDEQIKSWGKSSNKANAMWHNGVHFRGQLVVTDPATFTNAFYSGIGPGKAYGFGMMLLFSASKG